VPEIEWVGRLKHATAGQIDRPRILTGSKLCITVWAQRRHAFPICGPVGHPGRVVCHDLFTAQTTVEPVQTQLRLDEVTTMIIAL
jgi:hypothetical protein